MPKKYKHKSLKCPSCAPQSDINSASIDDIDQPNDSVSHLVSDCPAFADLRNVHDVQTDLGLVNYIKAVTEIRMELGD